MAESADDSRPNEMTISVKTPKEKHDIQISVNASVKELKDEVAKQFGTPMDQLCLIFAGKILKDPDTLEQLGIKDGLTVHLVIKTTSRPAEPALPSATPTTGPAQPDVSQSPFGLGSLGGLAGISGMGMGSANFMDMQQRMERELMGNPTMLRQMMENPFVQQMMSSPDVMRQLLMNNPQMRDLMERNPEISHMLNNPDLMRQTMELARNPAMLQELMRSQDRAMSNLESLPGGFNALQRMYRDIQEPMMSAAQDSLGSNPFANLANSGAGAGSGQQGRENTAPLPNPWGSSSGPTGTAPASGSSSTTSTSTSNPSQAQGLVWPSGTQSMMQQMMQNPQMMQNMMQAPYMQNILENMSTNPQLAGQVLGNNPMFADNPELLARFQDQLPTITAQLNNPDLHSAMSNPRALDAIMEIQQGMLVLESEAPEVFMGFSGLQGAVGRGAAGTTSTTTTTTTSSSVPPSDTTTTSDSAAGSNPTTTTTTSPTATSTSPATTGTAGTTLPGTGQAGFSNVMSQLMGMMMMGGGGQMGGGQGASQPPEQRYASQLEQLATMGFMDREANIRALTATVGDVNAAIDRLLQQR